MEIKVEMTKPSVDFSERPRWAQTLIVQAEHDARQISADVIDVSTRENPDRFISSLHIQPRLDPALGAHVRVSIDGTDLFGLLARAPESMQREFFALLFQSKLIDIPAARPVE